MQKHRYTLEPYKGPNTRYKCPSCKNRSKTFVRYIDTTTGEHLADHVGRCNRLNNCGYHYKPKQYFQNNHGLNTVSRRDAGNAEKYKVVNTSALAPPPDGIKPSFINPQILKQSLRKHDENNFVKFLLDRFGADATQQLISRYFIGSSNHWPGAAVFWQIDIEGKIRTGKIMDYDPVTGKRIKKPDNRINWVPRVLQLPDFKTQQCLFGEHLLKDKTKPVAIVESEKTATIASLYLPEYLWLAPGGLDQLNAEKCQVLKGRSVTLFPDLKGFEKWKAKANELSHIVACSISDLLERKASEEQRKDGLDLADYLLQFDHKQFTSTGARTALEQKLLALRLPEGWGSIEFVYEKIEKPEKPKQAGWQDEIEELELFFKGITLPTGPIKPNAWTTIPNVAGCIESLFSVVKAQQGNRTYLPYLEQLREMRDWLSN